MARDINPQLDVRVFEQGLNAGNLDAFLADGDLYLDGLDFFALDIRRQVFAMCERQRMPAVTVAPLGMGASLLNFVPGGMGFEQYFRLEGQPADEQALRFLVGLSPAMLQMSYLVDPSRVDLANRRGPSTAIGCATVQRDRRGAGGQAAAGPRARGRRARRPALRRVPQPPGAHLATGGGEQEPVAAAPGAPPSAIAVAIGLTMRPPAQHLQAILHAAMQAPSADNRHTLRFHWQGDALRLVSTDAATWPALPHRRFLALLAYGAVIENMALRSSEFGYAMSCRLLPEPDRPGSIAALQWAATDTPADPLARAIDARHTNRRFYRREKLSADTLARLSRAAEDVDGTRLLWLDDAAQRRLGLRAIRIAETERFRRRALHDELFGAVRFELGWKASADKGLPPGALEIERPMRLPFALLRHWPAMRAANWLGMHHVLGMRAGYCLVLWRRTSVCYWGP